MLRRVTSDVALPARADRCVNTIVAASVEMGVLIDDLLAFARMGQVEKRTTQISLSDLVTETVQGLELSTTNRHITWQIAPLPPVVGDAAMIKQVFANLIGNAVKYTQMRDPACIEIGCASAEDGRITVFVRDNGAGFDPQYAHKLFGIFQRLHRAEEFEGTGIGLATVKRIISRHGGRVWAAGELDRGATFYFTLQHT
jgi:light-regulated signal transduction histidine kinase (bacteriophytochrome)